jgi:hypothetical protein
VVLRACDDTQAETALNILCECEDSAKIRSCWFGKHFMQPGYHDENPLCKILYFTADMELLVEWKIWGCTIDHKIVTVQVSL